ncbi:MAG: glycosyltransferase [Acidobacteriaceae bacterium]|nr:glycosyltransferase [Acidobacteriaceae bacterium]
MREHRSKRLVHILPTFGIGGAEMIAASVVNGLGPSFEHVIVPLNGVRDAASRLHSSARADIVSAPGGKGTWRFPFRLYRSIRALSPDLVLTYNWGAMDAVTAATLGRICPVVHHEHGFGPDESITLKSRRVLVRSALLNTVPMTIVISKTLEHIALTRYRIQRKRVRFIQTGVDTHKYAPRRNPSLRAQLGIAPDRFVIGYVGGLREEKNPQLLLRSFAQAQMKNSHLLFVGDGPLRRDLHDLAGGLGLVGQVTFTGAIADTAPYYNIMNLFAMSSNTEQTPNALLEAMASGVPAVCTAAGDTKRILGPDAASQTVPIGDRDAYVRVLRLMQADTQLLAGHANANLRRCTELYSIDNMIEEYRRAYLSVIDAHTRPHA